MRDDQYLGKILTHNIDGLNQPLPALRILIAKKPSLITSVCNRAPAPCLLTSP